ncbi:hypothetical protein L9F63_015421, partial [Diploptera punctata]
LGSFIFSTFSFHIFTFDAVIADIRIPHLLSCTTRSQDSYASMLDGYSDLASSMVQQVVSIRDSRMHALVTRIPERLHTHGFMFQYIFLYLTTAANIEYTSIHTLLGNYLHGEEVFSADVEFNMRTLAVEVRNLFPEIDQLIGCGKIFLKAPSQ